MKIILKPLLIHLLVTIWVIINFLGYFWISIFYFIWNFKILKWNNFMYYSDTYKFNKIVYDENILETYRRSVRDLNEL